MSILASHLTKAFGSFKALDNVTLDVPSGKLVSLLGPSGSGKTTLLRIIAGLEHADGGEISIHGKNASSLSVRDRQVGFVFQHYALFRHMSVFDNVAFGLNVQSRRTRPSKPEIANRVHELLHLVQLDNLAARYPAQLSGGQRQRVALARALATRPKVLLLDEPFGALDAKVRKDLRRWLRAFHEEIQLTTIFVTHDQEEALEISDQVVVMNHARVEQTGSPQEVYDNPASPFVIEFLGSVNCVSDFDEGERKGSAFYVRPQDIEILTRPNGAPDLAAKVCHIFSAGSFARISLERTDGQGAIEAEITREHLQELGLISGDVVSLAFHNSRRFLNQKSCSASCTMRDTSVVGSRE